jgi:hypothetical protein
VRNAGQSVLTHLEIAIDGEPPRQRPVVCRPLVEGSSSAGHETKIMPGWPLEFACPVDGSAEAMQKPTATIIEAVCKAAHR